MWFPLNYLILKALQKFHHYLGDDYKVECPTRSGRMHTLWEVAAELSVRWSSAKPLRLIRPITLHSVDHSVDKYQPGAVRSETIPAAQIRYCMRYRALVAMALRIVLDSNVMVAALRSDRGASRRLLVMVLEGSLELLASVPLMIEYEAVLTRPEHREAIGLDVSEINEILNAVARVCTPVRLRFLWRPRLKDPADEMVLETAVNGGADWLVTFDLRHLSEAARDFGIQVMRPSEAWKEVRRRAKK